MLNYLQEKKSAPWPLLYNHEAKVKEVPMSEKMTSDNHTKNEAKEVKQCNVATIQSPWLKQSQARQYLQISATELSRKIATGEIKAVRRGNTIFTRTEWLDAWMESLPSAARVPSALAG